MKRARFLSHKSYSKTLQFIFGSVTGKLFFYSSTVRNILILQPSSFSVKKYEILIANIDVLSEISQALSSAGSSGFKVKAGYQLGTPTSRSQCEDFVHVTMRLAIDHKKTTDPKAYVLKVPLQIPQWISETDLWYVKLLGFTVKQVFQRRELLCMCMYV